MCVRVRAIVRTDASMLTFLPVCLPQGDHSTIPLGMGDDRHLLHQNPPASSTPHRHPSIQFGTARAPKDTDALQGLHTSWTCREARDCRGRQVMNRCRCSSNKGGGGVRSWCGYVHVLLAVCFIGTALFWWLEAGYNNLFFPRRFAEAMGFCCC